MTQGNDRTRDARDHDDSAIIEAMEDAPGGAGRGGGRLAGDLGTQDELKSAIDPDAPPTSVAKSDKVQPNIPTRNDHEGAQR